MTVEEANAAKKNLINNINLLLKQFEETSGCNVVDIRLTKATEWVRVGYEIVPKNQKTVVEKITVELSND